MRSPASTSARSAETVALRALGFLAACEGALERFMAASGADTDMIREQADDPVLLAAVMDFLLSDDALMSEFCDGEALDPLFLHRVRRALPGALPDA